MTISERLSRRTVALSFFAIYTVVSLSQPIIGWIKDGHWVSRFGFEIILLLGTLVMFPLGLLGLWPEQTDKPESPSLYLLWSLCYVVYVLMFCLMIKYRKLYQFCIFLTGLILLMTLNLKGCSIAGMRAINRGGL